MLMGVGAVPNTELAEAAGLTVDNGVVVDERFATSDPDVLAIGDVARARNTALGDAVRVEHWDNAIRQGKAVAKVLLGQDVAYDWQPYFYTDQYDLGMEYVGYSDPSNDVVVRGDQVDRRVHRVLARRPEAHRGHERERLGRQRRHPRPVGRTVDRERLADPDVPLAEVADD